MRLFGKIAAALAALALASCGTPSANFYPLGTGTAQNLAPIPSDKVQLFITKRPDFKYAELGMITYETPSSFSDEPRVYQIMRVKAGEIGADGLIIMDSQSSSESFPRIALDYYGNPMLTDTTHSYIKYRGMAIRRE